MALTYTKKHDQLLGAKRLMVFDLTFTSVTGGKIETGLNDVRALYQPNTSDDHGIVYNNKSDAGTTTSFGDVYVDGVTSNDTGTLFVIGQ